MVQKKRRFRYLHISLDTFFTTPQHHREKAPFENVKIFSLSSLQAVLSPSQRPGPRRLLLLLSHDDWPSSSISQNSFFHITTEITDSEK